MQNNLNRSVATSLSSSVGLILGVHTNGRVVNGWEFLEEFLFSSTVVITNHTFLISSETEHLAFFSSREVSKSAGSSGNFSNKDGHESVVLVCHNSSADASQSGLERRIHDSLTLGRVIHSSGNFRESSFADSSHEILEVLVLE